MTVRTNRYLSVLCKKCLQRKNTVAEIGFGARTKTNDRTGPGDRRYLIGLQMCRVHEAPFSVDVATIEQPARRPGFVMLKTLVYFALLFRQMDVQRNFFGPSEF